MTSSDHRAFVGPPEYYDILGSTQLSILVSLGMREYHKLLDVGCGSLRAGRFFMQYLLPGNYYGIEPNEWLIESAIEREIGRDMIRLKMPVFSSDDQFDLTALSTEFDYIVAQSIVTHAPLCTVRKLMKQASMCLSNDGIFVATFHEGESDNELTEWSYPGGVLWTQSTIWREATKAGLSPSRLDWAHPADQTWVQMVRW